MHALTWPELAGDWHISNMIQLSLQSLCERYSIYYSWFCRCASIKDEAQCSLKPDLGFYCCSVCISHGAQCVSLKESVDVYWFIDTEDNNCSCSLHWCPLGNHEVTGMGLLATKQCSLLTGNRAVGWTSFNDISLNIVIRSL